VSSTANRRTDVATGVNPPAHGALAVVRDLRDALSRADVEAAQRLRWLAPRPPGERDLLSDMAAAEGVGPAVDRLSRFWAQAHVRFEHVREIDGLEAEVYERLSLPGESLPIVSLVRRDAPHAPWRVVCTNEAQDERFVIWISVRADTVDEAGLTKTLGDAEVLMMDDGGVLGHSTRGWLAHVRGPFVPKQWPEVLPGEGGHVIELATALAPDAMERREQLAWVLRSASGFVRVLEGQAAMLPGSSKLLLPQALAAAASGQLSAMQAFRFWARIEESSGWFHTRGLGQLGLPEVEAPVDLLPSPERTAQLAQWMGATLLEKTPLPALGTELLLGEDSFLVAPGRRGPRRGKSYGRWGAIGLVSSDPRFMRGSRTRMRVPDGMR